MRRGFFDKAGQPINRDRYYELFEDLSYRRVAEDVLADGRRVSTVWLGIDHDFFGEETGPLIFETMAFGPTPAGKLIGQVLHQERAVTEAQARRAHADVLTRLRCGGAA